MPIAAHLNDLPEGFIPGTALASPIKADKTELPKPVLKEILNLGGAQPTAFLLKTLETWASIFLAIFLASYLNHPLVTILAILFIATRQNVLGLLIHEQAHFLGLKGRTGDIIVNLLIGYPLLLVSVESYAKTHLSHHRYYFSKNDPDFMRKNGPDWSFPVGPYRLFKLLLKDLLGANLLELFKGKHHETKLIVRNSSPFWLQIAFMLALLGIITYFNLWMPFLIYWVLPLSTILQLIIRLGAVCEHKYNIISSDIYASTPIIIPKLWERLILPNLNFSYHIYHHLYPNVSFQNLPKVHAIYKREKLVNNNYLFYGYFDYLKYMFDPKNR